MKKEQTFVSVRQERNINVLAPFILHSQHIYAANNSKAYLFANYFMTPYTFNFRRLNQIELAHQVEVLKLKFRGAQGYS